MAVPNWTGREAQALRGALRLSVRAFAQHLGVAVRTVSNWEKHGSRTTPRIDMQAVLDRALELADPQARQRFQVLLADQAVPSVPGHPGGDHPSPDFDARFDDGCRDYLGGHAGAGHAGAGHAGAGYFGGGSVEWDYETWTDDLERAAALLARQEFLFAAALIDRWLRRFDAHRLDDHGLYLRARSLVLLGDMQRDRGEIHASASARQSYLQAGQLFAQLAVPRRVAQVELSLAVLEEMSGRLLPAAARYRALADDGRLSARDRARARLWVGTALSKQGEHTAALPIMRQATRAFDELDEPQDWSVAHQKLALACRGAGDLGNALRYLEVALTHRSTDSPMQRVRLDTAHAHVLLSDTATACEGLRLLQQAADTARTYGMAHQLHSIDTIRRSAEPGHDHCDDHRGDHGGARTPRKDR